MPLYEEIASQVAERIAEAGLLPGDRIDSEQELCQEFQVSRGTVVKALDLLERGGIVRREQGRGTFVSGRRPALRSTTDIVSFTQHAEKTGHRPGGRLVRWQRSEASGDHHLHEPFEPGTPLVDFLRVRSIDDVPVGIHRVVMPEEIAQQAGLMQILEGDGPDTWSLYQLLGDAGVFIGRGDEQFAAVLADRQAAELLSVRRPCPLLRIERHTYDLVGRPIEVVDARYLSDRYSVSAESIRSGFAYNRPTKRMVKETR
jgi:GntR family transcriptional regulator